MTEEREMKNHFTTGISIMPIGFALLTIGMVFSNNLGAYRYLILLGAIFLLASSVLLLLFHVLKDDMKNSRSKN
jgi:hypothetical protein